MGAICVAFPLLQLLKLISELEEAEANGFANQGKLSHGMAWLVNSVNDSQSQVENSHFLFEWQINFKSFPFFRLDFDVYVGWGKSFITSTFTFMISLYFRKIISTTWEDSHVYTVFTPTSWPLHFPLLGKQYPWLPGVAENLWVTV